MRDLDGLIEKIEGLDGPDRDVDAEICIALQYGGENSEGASNVRTDPDWEGDLIFEIEGDTQPECCNPIPALTSSLDAAIALVERVLPEQWWNILREAIELLGWMSAYNKSLDIKPVDLSRFVIVALLRALQSQEKK